MGLVFDWRTVAEEFGRSIRKLVTGNPLDLDGWIIIVMWIMKILTNRVTCLRRRWVVGDSWGDGRGRATTLLFFCLAFWMDGWFGLLV